MHWFRLKKRLLPVATVLAALLLPAGYPARAQSIVNRPSLQELTEQADAIYIARCNKREITFRNGNIVSSYELRPSEYWKGGPTLSGVGSGGSVQIDQIGGSIDYPVPITQVNPTSVIFTEGQEVLLFTKQPEVGSGQASLAGKEPELPRDQPRIIGGAMGVFSVVRHPETGERLLTPGTVSGRINQERLAANITDKTDERVRLQAVAPTDGAARDSETEAAKDRVQPYEPMSQVRARVQSYVQQSEEKRQQP